MNRTCGCALAAMLFAALTPALAQDDVEEPDPRETALKNWGLAAGIGVEFYDDRYIETASLQGQNRLVVVEKDFESKPSFWAVGNWTVDDCGALGFIGRSRVMCADWHKPGFFVGAKLIGDSGEFLQGVTLGIQMAFLQNVAVVGLDGRARTAPRPSWNVGIGWVNHSVKSLAKGITEGEALPADFDDVILRESTDNGWIIMISKNIF